MSSLKSQFEDMNENALTIPNIMSLFRIVLIPFFVFFFLEKQYVVAMILIVVSGLTDFFDGKIARKFNQISKLGKLLDPAADKLTQVALAIIFFIHFNNCNDKTLQLFSYVFLLFCIKELAMIIGSFILLSINVVPQPAIIYGKVATFTFYVVMALLLCFAPEVGALKDLFVLPHSLIIVMVSISAVLTLVAFFSYFPDTIRRIKAQKKEKDGDTVQKSIGEDSKEG